MSNALEKFKTVVADTESWLKDYKKKSGKKILGCYPMYVPEELVHAAGILPVAMFEHDEPVTLADQHIHRYVCHCLRGIFDLSLKGEFDYLDGVVFTDFCLTTRMTSQVWIYNHDDKDAFYHCIFTPHNMVSQQAPIHLREEFQRLKKALEAYTGNEITEESLKNSIRIYNENRRLLKELYEIRRKDPEILKASDYVNVVAAGMIMPKEMHTELLKELLDEFDGVTKIASEKARVIVSGMFCELPNPSLMDMVEASNMAVCDDDIYTGRRYFDYILDEGMDPVEAMASRHLNDIPDPNKHNPNNEWVPYLKKLVAETGAEGIVMYVLKYCEAHLFDVPYLTHQMAEAGIPILIIETTEAGATEQMRTRLEAFSEMITLGRDEI